MTEFICISIASFAEELAVVALQVPLPDGAENFRIYLPGVFDYTVPIAADINTLHTAYYRICVAIERLLKIYRYYHPENVLFCGFSIDGTTLVAEVEIIGENNNPASSGGDNTVLAMLEMGLAEVKKAVQAKPEN